MHIGFDDGRTTNVPYACCARSLSALSRVACALYHGY
jgi:hypothetical protein